MYYSHEDEQLKLVELRDLISEHRDGAKTQLFHPLTRLDDERTISDEEMDIVIGLLSDGRIGYFEIGLAPMCNAGEEIVKYLQENFFQFMKLPMITTATRGYLIGSLIPVCDIHTTTLGSLIYTKSYTIEFDRDKNTKKVDNFRIIELDRGRKIIESLESLNAYISNYVELVEMMSDKDIVRALDNLRSSILVLKNKF